MLESPANSLPCLHSSTGSVNPEPSCLVKFPVSHSSPSQYLVIWPLSILKTLTYAELALRRSVCRQGEQWGFHTPGMSGSVSTRDVVHHTANSTQISCTTFHTQFCPKCSLTLIAFERKYSLNVPIIWSPLIIFHALFWLLLGHCCLMTSGHQ